MLTQLHPRARRTLFSLSLLPFWTGDAQQVSAVVLFLLPRVTGSSRAWNIPAKLGSSGCLGWFPSPRASWAPAPAARLLVATLASHLISYCFVTTVMGLVVKFQWDSSRIMFLHVAWGGAPELGLRCGKRWAPVPSPSRGSRRGAALAFC